MSETIELDAATVERLREARGRLDAEQPGVPKPSMDLFVNYLLDTEEAARDGYYTELSTSDD